MQRLCILSSAFFEDAQNKLTAATFCISRFPRVSCRLLRDPSRRLFSYVRTQSARKNLLSGASAIFKVCNRSVKSDCSSSKAGVFPHQRPRDLRSAWGDAHYRNTCETFRRRDGGLRDTFLRDINNRGLPRAGSLLVPRVLSAGHNKLSPNAQLSGGTF